MKLTDHVSFWREKWFGCQVKASWSGLGNPARVVDGVILGDPRR